MVSRRVHLPGVTTAARHNSPGENIRRRALVLRFTKERTGARDRVRPSPGMSRCNEITTLKGLPTSRRPNVLHLGRDESDYDNKTRRLEFRELHKVPHCRLTTPLK